MVSDEQFAANQQHRLWYLASDQGEPVHQEIFRGRARQKPERKIASGTSQYSELGDLRLP